MRVITPSKGVPDQCRQVSYFERTPGVKLIVIRYMDPHLNDTSI